MGGIRDWFRRHGQTFDGPEVHAYAELTTENMEAFIEAIGEERRVMGLPAYTYEQMLAGETYYCKQCGGYGPLHNHE